MAAGLTLTSEKHNNGFYLSWIVAWGFNLATFLLYGFTEAWTHKQYIHLYSAKRVAFLLLVHSNYSIKNWLKVSHGFEDQSELNIIECLDNTCVEVCYIMMMSVMSLQLQQLYRAKYIITAHETTSPSPTENQTTTDGKGEIADTRTPPTHTHVQEAAISVGQVSLNVSLYLPVRFSFSSLFCLSLTVILLQQHHWLHHVSEHHHCHIKHGWVPCTTVSIAGFPSRCYRDQISIPMLHAINLNPDFTPKSQNNMKCNLCSSELFWIS